MKNLFPRRTIFGALTVLGLSTFSATIAQAQKRETSVGDNALSFFSRVKNPKEAFFSAARSGNITQMQNLLNKGVDKNVQDELGNTPLMIAASRPGNSQAVSFLISRKENVNIKNKVQQTAIYFAVNSGDLRIVSQLITSNAQTNIKDAAGLTPIASAQNILSYFKYTDPKRQDYLKIISKLGGPKPRAQKKTTAKQLKAPAHMP